MGLPLVVKLTQCSKSQGEWERENPKLRCEFPLAALKAMQNVNGTAEWLSEWLPVEQAN